MGTRRKSRSLIPSEIFLSHSHKDHAATVRLAEVLQRHGVPSWFSERNISGAQQWLDEIGAALERCDWFIVLLTPAAVESKWVKRELTYALNEDRYDGRVIPLLVQDCDYKKLAWPLSTLQIIPFRRFPTGCTALLKLWGIGYRPG
jgi:hypothetical protein